MKNASQQFMHKACGRVPGKHFATDLVVEARGGVSSSGAQVVPFLSIPTGEAHGVRLMPRQYRYMVDLFRVDNLGKAQSVSERVVHWLLLLLGIRIRILVGCGSWHHKSLFNGDSSSSVRSVVDA